MDLNHEVIPNHQNIEPKLHMVGFETFNYNFKIALTSIMKSSFVITPSPLVIFKLLIFALFNLTLLICTFLAKEVF